LKSGVEAIALTPSDLDFNEVKTVEIQEVEVELEAMKKSMDNS
jgi:phage shock protein A